MYDKLKNSDATINYAFVPATLPVQAAMTGPGTLLPLSHIRPIPGGVNARLRICWRATSPILCGDEGVSRTYRFEYEKKRNNQFVWTEGCATIKLTAPLKNGWQGRHTLSGTALAGMIRNVLKVASGSFYAPINRGYKCNSGPGLDRAEHPITSADINSSTNKTRPSSRERKAALSKMKTSGEWQTIADVANRSYVADDPDALPLDWANAMMGFVLGTDAEKANHNADQWRPPWPEAVQNQFPQGLESRISFGFADCTTKCPSLWPENDPNIALKVTGAEPKVSYHPSYLAQGKWNDPNALLAGLKLYPVHDPHKGALSHTNCGAVFGTLDQEDRGQIDAALGDSDTLLQFLDASDDTPLDFEGIITCRNLHADEFGALIWSLFLGKQPEFGQYDGDLRHNIGHLRGFGMGQLAPVLLEADVSLNPTEDDKRQEKTGKCALKFLHNAMGGFQNSEVGGKTDTARKRLILFKSRAYGKILKESKYKRLKSYTRPDGRIGNAFSKLKNAGFRLTETDDEITGEEPTATLGNQN